MAGPDVIRSVLERATLSIEDLARETGVSSATLFAWQAGRRNPSPKNLAKLAGVLRRRGGELAELAGELEE